MDWQKKRLAAGSLIMLSGILLSGCWRDSSSPDSSGGGTDTSLTGTFVDSAVDGLSFASAAHTGQTAGGGHYQFEGGETVTFKLGELITLGSLTGSEEEVSPSDFFDEVDLADPRLRNILILLQSLDSDGDTSNGITITAEAIALLEQALSENYDPASLNLSEMTEDEAIAFQTDLIAALTYVVDNTESPDDVVVDEQDAVTHYSDVLGGISIHKNISRTPEAGSGNHSIASMTTVFTDKTTSSGSVDTSEQVHPLLVSYTDVVTGDFAMGTGSSEIPDIEHVADVFVGLSLDNGSTWKLTNISNTADKSSVDVDFWGTGTNLPYYGHSFKPAIRIQGNNVLVAWNDKYCASGNPLNLEDTSTTDTPVYAADLYLVNGPQGTIDYEGAEYYGDELVPAHEVPFSCVMSARGIYDDATHQIIWHAPMQLTTGRRDSNKIAIASSAAGFVVTWQEDPDGLRPGKGAGPGDGWSGASVNHGADIWYSYITMADFTATEGTVVDGVVTKPKSLNNLSYPVRITDNAVCKSGVESAQYCTDLCTNNGYLSDATSNDDGKCYSDFNDPITEIYNTSDSTIAVEPQLLNGDTGASRPVIGLFGATGTTVILGYEETKGLAENLPGIPNTESVVDIEDQGKIAYVHAFEMDTPDTIAPGKIVNPLRPNEADGTWVLENVRRLTMVTQVDPAEATPGTDYLWGILYKSGIETQGGSSDMYLSLATDYTLESMTSPQWNLSARTDDTDDSEFGTWSSDNLDDATWENDYENTFSPRGFLRGSRIFIGFEYTPSWRIANQEHLANNFFVIRSFDNGANWQAPVNISNITNNVTSTLDPRLIPAAMGVSGSPLASDTANPDVIFVSYGTLDLVTGLEADLFVTRSTDAGATWEKVPSTADPEVMENDYISKTVAEEKEVQGVPTPDGNTLYSIWLQELDPEDPEAAEAPDHIVGSDIWIQRRDYTAE